MTFCAACGSRHNPVSSARLLSWLSRSGAVSTSMMPPQQGQRLADGIGEFFNFGPHGEFLGSLGGGAGRLDIGAARRPVNATRLPEAAAPAAQTARRVLLVAHEKAAALVGEAND